MMADLALSNSIATEGKQRIQISSAECDARRPGIVLRGKDDLCQAVVCTDLYAAFSRRKLAALDRAAHGFRSSVVLPIVHERM